MFHDSIGQGHAGLRCGDSSLLDYDDEVDERRLFFDDQTFFLSNAFCMDGSWSFDISAFEDFRTVSYHISGVHQLMTSLTFNIFYGCGRHSFRYRLFYYLAHLDSCCPIIVSCRYDVGQIFILFQR